MQRVSNIQLGKQGATDNFIETLRTHFKKHKNVRISVLKSARDSKESVKKHSEDILNKLGQNYTSRVIGFTIVLKKHSRAVR